MSYFVCGYKTKSTDIEALCEFILDAVPVDKQNSSLRLGGTCSQSCQLWDRESDSGCCHKEGKWRFLAGCGRYASHKVQR